MKRVSQICIDNASSRIELKGICSRHLDNKRYASLALTTLVWYLLRGNVVTAYGWEKSRGLSVQEIPVGIPRCCNSGKKNREEP